MTGEFGAVVTDWLKGDAPVVGILLKAFPPSAGEPGADGGSGGKGLIDHIIGTGPSATAKSTIVFP